MVLYRQIEGDTLKEKVMKTLVIKDWFLNKKAEEFRKNLTATRAFAILKETEKAYNVMYSLSPNYAKCFWVPKSATEWQETENSDHATRIIEDYDKALSEFKTMWSAYI